MSGAEKSQAYQRGWRENYPAVLNRTAFPTCPYPVGTDEEHDWESASDDVEDAFSDDSPV